MARTETTDASVSAFAAEEAALIEALTNRDAAQAATVTAASANDLKVMLEAFDNLKQAQSTVARAQTKLNAAQYEFKATERMALSVDTKEAAEQWAASIDTAGMYRLGLKAVHIVIAEDGSTVVSVTATEKPKTATKSSTRVPGESGGKTRAGIMYNGNVYTSRQFLELFPEGLEAIDRNDNWEAKGLKARPGFDQELRKLMNEHGATRESVE